MRRKQARKAVGASDWPGREIALALRQVRFLWMLWTTRPSLGIYVYCACMCDRMPLSHQRHVRCFADACRRPSSPSPGPAFARWSGADPPALPARAPLTLLWRGRRRGRSSLVVYDDVVLVKWLWSNVWHKREQALAEAAKRKLDKAQ